MSWARQVRESWFPLRLIDALVPSSVCLLSLALILPDLAWIDSPHWFLSAFAWLSIVILFALVALTLPIAVFVVLVRVPKFLTPPSRRSDIPKT
jgi:hypothetical protein